LKGFGDLPDEDREILFETFRVWQDNDASVRGAAEVLICHRIRRRAAGEPVTRLTLYHCSALEASLSETQ
jgi:hypothetical protein